MDNWWTKAAVISQVVDWAYDMQKANPKARILSLGQSPAWIVQSVGMIRKLRGQPANITFIPFTGSFVEREYDGLSSSMSFDDRDLARPPIDRITRYFNLLGHIGAKPTQIAASKSKIVLAEMIKSGNGLASFLDIWSTRELYDYSPDQLDAVEIYAYDAQPNTNKDFLTLQNRDRPFRLKRVSLSPQEAELMEGITPHNIAESRSSRLVPMYRLSARAEEKGLEIIPNRINRLAIKLALHAEIQQREQAAHRDHVQSMAHNI